MNLLNSVFNVDDIEIIKNNKKYIIYVVISLLIIFSLLIIKKDYYYSNGYSVTDDDIVLLVEKQYVNRIKDAKEIIISDRKYNYNIKKIVSLENDFLVNVNLNVNLEKNNNGTYRVCLGKESMFDYIIRIIKN